MNTSTINYLRISVTDRCNLRCIYCSPLGDSDFLAPTEVLSFEEIERIAKLSVDCGIRRVRLTGGEPLVRRDICTLVTKLAAIKELKDLSLTTNGVLLGQMAHQLRMAGLNRVNVSVDAADSSTYEKITGCDCLPRVIRGIYRAIEVGLTPVKINSVILRATNDSQISALAALTMHMPVTVRFIEYCPTNAAAQVTTDFVPTSEVYRIIEERFGPLTPVVAGESPGPAAYFRIAHSAGNIGFISGRTSMFCRSCNRIRLTSDGQVKPCLYANHTYDVKKLMRAGADDAKVAGLLRTIIAEKGRHTRVTSTKDQFSMRKLGG